VGVGENVSVHALEQGRVVRSRHALEHGRLVGERHFTRIQERLGGLLL
jgi:hypothetical protein